MSNHWYNTKKLMQVLTRFCESEEGGDARVQMILPEGRNPMQKEFNIKEIKLIENKLIGPKYEKYRLMILVEQHTLKNESKLWQKVKKKTPNITWTRVESWASFGFPDLVGYTEKRGFFTVELKVSKGNKLTFSPHQIAFHIKHPTNTFIIAEHHEQRAIKLYEGSAIQELVACGLELDACCLGLDALEERLLLGA